MIDSDNYRPKLIQNGKRRLVKCLLRNCDVIATPEELVRQTILGFLLHDRGWAHTRLKLEERVRFTDGSSGRADIVQLDGKGQHHLVIECKEPAIRLGEDVKRQAILYAQVLRGKAVWLTNGKENRFFVKHRPGDWRETDQLEELKMPLPPVLPPEPPKDIRSLSKFNLAGLATPTLRGFAVSALQLIFAKKSFYRLPWSYGGVHILEDRGISELSIRTPGGSWSSSYRLFLVATEGRVVTAGIGLNRWGSDGLILCAAFLKHERKHHSLQLQAGTHVERDGDHFVIRHDGKMGGRSLPRSRVINAIYEACRDDLLDEDSSIRLGTLPAERDSVTWKDSRKFLSNFFHYAVIRTDLRESSPYQGSE